MATPTICRVRLQTDKIQSFLPGQWVDVALPGKEKPPWVGGFSIASVPDQLPLIELLVKRSEDAAARWVHEQVETDQQVEIRVQGACVWDPMSGDRDRPLTLVAGGIGIAPIYSIFRCFLTHRKQNNFCAPIQLLYSATTEHELVLGQEIRELERDYMDMPTDSVCYSLTRGEWSPGYLKQYGASKCRIGRQLHAFLDGVGYDNKFRVYYICGPPSMIDDGVSFLQSKGVGTEPYLLREMVVEKSSVNGVK